MTHDWPLAARIPEILAPLIDEPALISAVMEDLALPEGERIQAWGVTLVIPAALATALSLREGPMPYVNRQLYEALAQARPILMGDREIGLAGASEGVHLAVLHFWLRPRDLAAAYTRAVIAIANDAFRLCHSGYRLAAFYYENCLALDQVALNSGFLPLAYAQAQSVSALPPDLRPMFYRLTAADAAMSLPGSAARNCFVHSPPQFRFSAAQRRLLWLSLFDESDEVLQQALGASVHGLKKLWRGIYERIEDRAPEFFGQVAGIEEGRRGPEKRRQALAYVRQRHEELRPWS